MDASGLMEKKLYMVRRFLEAVPEALVNGPEPERGAPHILNMSFPNVRGETLLHALEAEGVYASTGSACSSRKKKVSPVLLAMGISPDRAECALRFSLSPHTELEEIDRAAEALREIYPKLKRFQRR
ncbi:MAG: Cysteine desulfurase [Firmicutes bacterium ADurb.Bin467]|nr:MAG: Cysteine desulfurase [Firmicutes bacterium ADurb.Bin467]